ncbi:MlaE family ABC transporter permease [Marinospirillum perlucidum]|uniref:MlaE family ABC transporter permease n=1 Tax=Marinospirillum perlucidum TaxID=1982602 RepID=UPI000DF4A39E|nr:ABC transporter permease [Marinospirillum perlucidum]
MESTQTSPKLLTEASQMRVQGNWTSPQLARWLALKDWLQRPALPLLLDCREMDTNGALVFLQIFGAHPSNWPQGLTARQTQLLYLVRDKRLPPPRQEKLNWLADLGYRGIKIIKHARQLLDFIGRLSLGLVDLLLHPGQLKLKLILDVIQKDGLHALPIISLMAFLLGAVIAWQGGLQLATYGANIFIVELVAITHLRELGPLIAAILVAGRSGSAYAAQLATMKMNQEIQALETLGQDAYAWLVFPKLAGLLITLPLLTVLADLAGLAGGMLVASLQLDISPTAFWQRLGSSIPVGHFWVGLVKAPVFALVIVLVGCMQGFLAKGGAEAVGQRTTRSVVQAIFLVIILDAIFSIIFSRVGWS